MRKHDLKVWPAYFAALTDGSKSFEVRRNDRDFAVGDLLRLHEYDPAPDINGRERGATGQSISRVVTYVMLGGRFGIQSDFCVLALAHTAAEPEGNDG